MTTSYPRIVGAKSTNHGLFWNGANWVPGLVTASNITAGSITNTEISASAAIAKTKLAALAIVNADVSTTAAITQNKLYATPYCVAYRSAAGAAQSFAAASGLVTFNTAMQTDATMWTAGSPTRVFAPYTGWYEIAVDASATGASLGANDYWRVLKGGATVLASAAFYDAANGVFNGEVGAFNMTATEYVELQWFRTAATGVSTFADSLNTALAPGTPNGSGHFGALRMRYIGG